ncbi:hypothetical protein Tdes44962_MAKER08633 [Teratosphaeria destructans]|uniref:Uncharacterized protein n=1 Tax=Teratosphaeria destructans TaxID=418781 RepID=A0A9W7SVP3_9PEZI|nr:hypothetical protein Tdes44962_MAKER08633 [Teratosphaeria destructans]
MSSQAVTKPPQHDVAETADGGYIEEKSKSASASASAGLNLNVFGALKGAFSSSEKKETRPDGSEVTDRHDRAVADGAGAGNAAGAGAGAGQMSDRSYKETS